MFSDLLKTQLSAILSAKEEAISVTELSMEEKSSNKYFRLSAGTNERLHARSRIEPEIEQIS